MTIIGIKIIDVKLKVCANLPGVSLIISCNFPTFNNTINYLNQVELTIERPFSMIRQTTIGTDESENREQKDQDELQSLMTN
jgi:hypothetical protein